MAETALSVDLALAGGAALIGGMAARLLRQSVLVGYIAAGLALSPFTPGPTGDTETIERLADIGVVLLMFGVGVQFSIRELLATRAPALGAAVQVPTTTAIGFVAARIAGWSWQEAVFFGAVASISSSIVLTKLLAERGQEESLYGRVALVWSLAQDIGTVALVVFLAALTERSGGLLLSVGLAALKAAAFIGAMVLIGTRVLPRLLAVVARTGSRELFILAVSALSLGTAILAERLGLSLALGAFIAGVVVSESDLSYHALGEVLPIRDIFAALFFVSIGMLVDPLLLWDHLLVFLFLVAVILSKGLVILALGLLLLHYPLRTAVLAGAVLAQSAEFSFILARQGVSAGVVSDLAFSLMVAATAATIILAPALLRLAPAVERMLSAVRVPAPRSVAEHAAARPWRNHVVICGAGRVGTLIASILHQRGQGYVFIEIDRRRAEALRARGEPVLYGDAASGPALDRACLERARTLVITVADPLSVPRIIDEARRRHPRLDIVTRAVSNEQAVALRGRGAAEAVIAERELALELARHTLHRIGVPTIEAQAVLHRLRFDL